MNIQEDYVSFETAKLLKEKGFNERLLTFYITDEAKKEGCFQLMAFTDDKIDNNHSDHCYLAPTLQMAIKWLREVHKLHIAILWDCGAYIGKNSFCYHIDRMDNYEDRGYNKIGFDSSEEATEAAIKYCLENLI